MFYGCKETLFKGKQEIMAIIELSIEQARQIIDALNAIVDTLSSGVYEYEEARALAEVDSQRDSIFIGESL